MSNTKKNVIYVIGGLVLIGVIAGLSVYFARTGGGAINVNDQIRATDQTGFANVVLPDSQSPVPNGGLRPQGAATAQPPAPEPVPPQPVATSTDAASTTTTGAVATTT